MRVPAYHSTEHVNGLSATRASYTNPAYDAVSHLGEAAVQRVEHFRQEQDTADVLTAFNGFRDESRKQLQGFLSRKGKDARGGMDEFKAWADKRIAEVSGKLSGDRQTNTFMGLASNHRAGRLDVLARHEAAEHQTYKKQTLDSTYSGAEQEIILNPFDDDAREGEIDRYIAYLADQFPGEDMGAYADGAEQKFRTAALTAMIDQDPARAEKYLEQWKDDIGVDAYVRFKAGYQRRETQRVAAAEKAERAIEQAHQTEVDDTDFDTWQLHYSGELTDEELEHRADMRLISQATYKALREKRLAPDDPGAETDDPLVVAGIQADLARGLDVRAAAKQALEAGQMKGSTYVSIIKGQADKSYREAAAYVAKALQPTQADQWSPDRNIRYAEASDRLNVLIDRGEDPMTAAYQVVNQYTSDTRRTIKGLRAPVYLSGGRKSDSQSLDAAEKATVEALERDEIDADEFNEEIELITRLRELSAPLEDADSTDEELKRRIGK